MGLSDIPGSKATKALVPDYVGAGPQFYFDPIDLTEKEDELGIDDPLWFSAPNTDPNTGENIPGYLVEIEGSELRGLELAVMGDDSFEVLLFDETLGEFVVYEEDLAGGTLLTLPDGTQTFRVMGFEEEYDIFSPFFFMSPIGLLFDPQSYPDVTITPLPEPATITLPALGGLVLLRRRRS